MASMQFSWSDSLHAAVSSCLPCFKHPDSDSEDAQPPRARHPHPAFAHAIPPPRARPDELEGLLADASDDADALSLHTNPGERRTRKKRRKQPKHIRVFGFDLFGRAPPIQLPESDDEDSGSRRGGSSGSGNGRGSLRPGGEEGRTRKVSTSTLDSDAAPLDASRIEELSAARNAEALAREEEERRAKEERRRRRRERRELKRATMARALELQANGGEEFEGFQGSGPAYGPTSPFSPSLGSGTGTLSDSVTSSQQQQQQHEFGPFAHGQPVEPFDPDAAEAAREAAEAEADFGGESYTARPRKSMGRSSHGAGAGTMSTSDTRSSSSRGTGSHGYAAPYNHQFLASLHAPTHAPGVGAGVGAGAGVPCPPLSPLSQDGDADSVPPSPHVTERNKKRRKSKSASASKSLSVSTSSQSATASSLTSPPPSAPAHLPTTPLRVVLHGDDFEGFPGDFGPGSGDIPAGGAMVDLHAGAGAGAGKDEDAQAREEEEEAKRSAYVPVARFPSAGFGRTASRSSNSNSDAGVFLARRGDE